MKKKQPPSGLLGFIQRFLPDEKKRGSSGTGGGDKRGKKKRDRLEKKRAEWEESERQRNEDEQARLERLKREEEERLERERLQREEEERLERERQQREEEERLERERQAREEQARQARLERERKRREREEQKRLAALEGREMHDDGHGEQPDDAEIDEEDEEWEEEGDPRPTAADRILSIIRKGWVHIRPALLPRLHRPDEPSWHLLPWLLGVAFILRAIVALSGDFVIHPDEIMQYLEPAHGLVFGNSVVYWEFYYGARSWLVPSVVATVLWLCDLIGLGEPVYYIAAVKLFFCALSLLIPLAMYTLGRHFYGEQTGRIALLLGVFWHELVGFAHKPMTEFVSTSLLLFLMAYALRPRPHRLSTVQTAFVAALATFIVAVRFQYGPLLGFIWLVVFLRTGNNRLRLVMIAASIATVLLIGLFEYASWGRFMQSYWLNFKVNLVLNQAREGESTMWRYVGWPTLASGGLFALTALAVATDYRRRWFFLLLSLVIILPHMMQAHREYRFIFAFIPLWLLLLANFLAVGWEVVRKESAPTTTAANARRWVGLAYALLVSVVGISNALPMQGWLYKAHSQESGYVQFLRGQDEIFTVYRHLAADESVKGVMDITGPYFNKGGYYYLHHKVPYYDGQRFPLVETKNHVSHIVAHKMVKPLGVVRINTGQLILRLEDDDFLLLPSYVSDSNRNQLFFVDGDGTITPLDGFEPDYAGERFTIWKADADRPVRDWKKHRVYADNVAMYPFIRIAVGDDSRKPAKNLGIEYVDE